MIERLPGRDGSPLSAHLLLVRLGLAFAFVLLGTFPILAGLGVLRLESPIEPLAIPIALLFGAIFVGIGVLIVRGPMLGLARAEGAETPAEARALAWRRLRGRATRASAVGALDLALLALACGLAAGGLDLPFLPSEETLAQVVALEFLTIHAFPFLVVAATFWRGTDGGPRAAVAALTLLLTLGYGVGAWVLGGGPWGLFWMAWLSVPNLTPFLAGRAPGQARLLVVSRWCLKMTLFMTTAGVVGGGDLSGPGVAGLGALYFALVTGVELLRLPELPGDLARAERRLAEGSRAAPPGVSAAGS